MARLSHTPNYIVKHSPIPPVKLGPRQDGPQIKLRVDYILHLLNTSWRILQFAQVSTLITTWKDYRRHILPQKAPVPFMKCPSKNELWTPTSDVGKKVLHTNFCKVCLYKFSIDKIYSYKIKIIKRSQFHRNKNKIKDTFKNEVDKKNPMTILLN